MKDKLKSLLGQTVNINECHGKDVNNVYSQTEGILDGNEFWYFLKDYEGLSFTPEQVFEVSSTLGVVEIHIANE